MPRSIGDICRDVMLAIALNQEDVAERRALLEIMRDDGLLSDAEIAALGLGRAA